MYELKKLGKVFTSKFVATGPSSYKKKKNLPGRGLTAVEKHCSKGHIKCNKAASPSSRQLQNRIQRFSVFLRSYLALLQARPDYTCSPLLQ
jgi:hypothetical protein